MSSSSSDDERGLGLNKDAFATGEKCLAYVLFTHESDKEKHCFFVIGPHTFILAGVPTKLTLAENTFYEMKLKKATKMAGKFDVVKSEDLLMKMTWGKKGSIPPNVDQLLIEAKEYATKNFGSEKMESLDEAMKIAKTKKATSLGVCWAFLVYNSKFNENFGSGILVVYTGSRVSILNHKTQNFDDLEENSFVVLKKFSVGPKEELVATEESKIEANAESRAEVLQRFYKMDHIKNESSCIIGHVASTEVLHFNPNTGKRYGNNGKYVVFTVEDRASGDMKVLRVWGDNIRIGGDVSETLGKLVMIPTNHKTIKDGSNMMTGFCVIGMKTLKRLSDMHGKDESTKVKKV